MFSDFADMAEHILESGSYGPAAALNLAPGDEIGLAQLRKLLQDAGLHDDERKATSSIQRNITLDDFRDGKVFAGFLRFVGFDVTTAYGLYPSRALIEILAFGFLFAFVY